MRTMCEKCGGKSICAHNRNKNICKDCRVSLLCEHNCLKHNCKVCVGSGICKHLRQRQNCKECLGTSFCVHLRFRRLCKPCGGAAGKHMYQQWLQHNHKKTQHSVQYMFPVSQCKLAEHRNQAGSSAQDVVRECFAASIYCLEQTESRGRSAAVWALQA